MLPATIVMNTRRPIIGRSRRLALAGLRLFTPSPSQKAGGWRRNCLWGARVELTAAPKLCRQSAVASLALHDQASAAEHDLAPSARLTDRVAGHEVVRAVLSDRQLDIVRLGAWLVHHALPRASHGLDVGHHDWRNRADASAAGSEATNPITTVTVIMAQSERVPLDIKASLLSRGSTVVQRRRWPR